MDLGLAGRVALVCGSTKGLGRAVAKALAHEGARVAINGRHEESVQHAAQQLSSESAQAVMPFVADVGDPARSEEHTSELQSRLHLVCRLLLEKKKKIKTMANSVCRQIHDKDRRS